MNSFDYEVDPLVRVIKLRRKAKRAGAHPSVIARLESMVSIHARTAINQFKETESQFPILSEILDSQVLKDSQQPLK